MTNALLSLSLSAASAELQLALAALLLLVAGVYMPARKAAALVGIITTIVLAACALMLLLQLRGFSSANSDGALALALPFHGLFTYDILSQFTKMVVAITAAVASCLSFGWVLKQREPAFEYFILLLLSCLGLFLLCSSSNFLTFYAGLELQSLAMYVLVAIRRDHVLSSEAALKYFVLGALSSGLLLFGISLLYGASGSILFSDIAAAYAATGEDTAAQLPLLFGSIFVLAGLAFKLSSAPFHMWAPDVYEGAPVPTTAFLAAVPKIAVFTVLLRLLQVFGDTQLLQPLLVIMAAASMLLGAFAALGQKNIKRLLAYSSIGHMGYAMIGLAAGTTAGWSALYYYLILYSLMTLGAFAFLLALPKDGDTINTLDDVAGLARTRPLAAYGFAFILLSMAGLPVFVGFFAKLAVFMAAIDAGMIALAIIGALSSAVAAYYYLKICKIMFFDAPAAGADHSREHVPLASKLVLTASGAACLLLFLYPAGALQQGVADVVRSYVSSTSR